MSGTVTVTATASDNVGVTLLEIYIDGALKTSGMSSPLSYSWNTSGLSGSHTIFSKAYDAAGNVGTSTTVTVTVSSNTVQQLFQNTGFETGNLNFWTAGGVYLPFVTNAQHYTGNYSAQLGASTGTQNGDSWISQDAAIPSTSDRSVAELLLQGLLL